MNQNITNTFSSFLLASSIVLAAGCAPTAENHVENPRHQGAGEQVGEYIDDSVITATVKAKLINDSDISAVEVNVETYKGVVQLSGFVKEATDIAKASELARTVRGVQAVRNDIRLKESTY